MVFMPKPKTSSGEKNLISQRLIELRKLHNLSQRDLARKLQLAGYAGPVHAGEEDGIHERCSRNDPGSQRKDQGRGYR